jgi:UDP-glucose 4-epimerase
LLAKAEVLIHVGAFTPKNARQANAIAQCNSNINFTEKLLSLRFKSLRKVIYISTLDVYKPVELTTESTPTLPITLYGWSKLYCESMTAIFAETHNLPYQILRIGHVYGPGEEKYAKFLPKAIKNIVAGDAVELWGDGNEVRSFIYIDDVVAAILRAVNLNENVGPINVVGSKQVTIRELLNLLVEVSERSVSITQKEFHGFKRNYIFDNTKLLQHLLPVETDLRVGLKTEYIYMSGLM